MSNNDPTTKTPLSAPGIGGSPVSARPESPAPVSAPGADGVAISASPAVSAGAAVLPEPVVDAGAIPAPVQPAAAVPAPALYVLEPEDGPARQELPDDCFDGKYDDLVESYPVDDTEELKRFLRENPGLLDALRKIAPQLLDRPDVEDIVIRYWMVSALEIGEIIVNVYTHYTASSAATQALSWMRARISMPALWPFLSGIFLIEQWREDRAGEPCPAVPESLDPALSIEDFDPPRLLPDPPDDEFRRNCKALLDGFPVEQSDGLVRYLNNNRDIPGVLLKALPQIQARPDVDRVWINHVADPESDYENIFVDVHTSYTEYRPCSRAVSRMRREIVEPVLGISDSRICLASLWRYVDDS